MRREQQRIKEFSTYRLKHKRVLWMTTHTIKEVLWKADVKNCLRKYNIK